MQHFCSAELHVALRVSAPAPQAGKFPTLVQHSDNLETKVTEVRSQAKTYRRFSCNMSTAYAWAGEVSAEEGALHGRCSRQRRHDPG